MDGAGRIILNRFQKPNAAELNELLAEQILSRLGDAIAKDGEARMAVSGGSTPIALFQHLSHQDFDWTKVKITLVDDRCVSADHKDSNAKLVRDNLLQDSAKDAQFLPLYLGDSVLDNKDKAYEAEAESMIDQNFPNYAVVILGMGGDAHTASIFPQAVERDMALDTEQSKKCLITHPVTASYIRLTQTLAHLLKTDLLALHIVGAEKMTLLESVAESTADGAQGEYPISHFIQQTQTPLSVYCCP
jgi:6-phosphogluconolactonase